jgi:hypothetical protein
MEGIGKAVHSPFCLSSVNVMQYRALAPKGLCGTLGNGTLEDVTARPELRAHHKIADSSICEEFEYPFEVQSEVDESGLPFWQLHK